MDKRIFAVLVTILLFVSSIVTAVISPAVAAQQKKQAAPEPSPAEILAQQKKQAEAKARETLKAQEWVVYLTHEDGKPSSESDVITFTDAGKISSKNLLAKGYTDSNYRLTVEDSGVIIWETMKVNEDKDLAFLRGELRAGVMVGSIFFKPQKGRTETFYFTTVKPPLTVTEEAPKKKRKQ